MDKSEDGCSKSLAFLTFEEPRMNLEEEDDKGGADGEVLEEGSDDFGDYRLLSGALFG